MPLSRLFVRSALVLSLAGAAACGGSDAPDAAPASDAAAPAAPAAPSAEAPPAGDGPLVTVWKSPTCGCCTKWVEHMQANGFRTVVHDVDDIDAAKREHGVPGHLGSCHTAEVGGYALEGHVPAEVVRRLLSERPQVAGVAVPGMPIGSPGMEVGSRKDPYDVIAFTKDGQTQVFQTF
jgi:hypothetical protein